MIPHATLHSTEGRIKTSLNAVEAVRRRIEMFGEGKFVRGLEKVLPRVYPLFMSQSIRCSTALSRDGLLTFPSHCFSSCVQSRLGLSHIIERVKEHRGRLSSPVLLERGVGIAS